MSWSWYIYSERRAAELNAVLDAYETALAALPEAEAAAEAEDALAEAGPGGPAAPSPAALLAQRAEYRDRAAVLDRLPRCASTVELAYVRADPGESPLQVSALRFLLSELAPCLMDWGDLSIELGEDALQGMARMRSRGTLGAAAAPARRRKPVKPRAARAGELRAIQILARIDAARGGDRDAAHDVQRVARVATEPARRYLELLVESGACSDRAAAKRLGLSTAAIAAAAEELARALD